MHRADCENDWERNKQHIQRAEHAASENKGTLPARAKPHSGAHENQHAQRNSGEYSTPFRFAPPCMRYANVSVQSINALPAPMRKAAYPNRLHLSSLQKWPCRVRCCNTRRIRNTSLKSLLYRNSKCTACCISGGSTAESESAPSASGAAALQQAHCTQACHPNCGRMPGVRLLQWNSKVLPAPTKSSARERPSSISFFSGIRIEYTVHASIRRQHIISRRSSISAFRLYRTNTLPESITHIIDGFQ